MIRIGVLMGGPSSEHEVSLNTGKVVLENLDKSKYKATPIKIAKDGKWFIGEKQVGLEKVFRNFNLIFNALHGTFGEDGRVQALMEYYGVRYTGSGIIASALAMDKLRSREIFKLAGLRVPNTLKIRRGDNYQALLNVFVGKVTNFPVVVKPCSNGSSVGVEIANDCAGLEKAIAAAFKIDKKVLIEEFIEGREVTCGVLDGPNGQPVQALPVTEIIPKKGNKFFNYRAKYKSGHSDEITPAQLDEETTKKIQDIAVKAHQILGCKTYSRADMMIRDNDIYLLEVNTLPGLTTASLFPKAASAAGLTLSQLFDIIVVRSL
ncbi:MAG: D-alanine--D-alanine ligase [Candidatus Yanofskybacteria bacterium]|nr:D-alanine--D-alanine ligase [Candidatus Yanofskybacteria bacterium]